MTDLGPLQPLYDAMTGPPELWRKSVLLRAGAGKLVASPVALKRGPAVRLVETVGRREETRNVALEEWPERLAELFSGPLQGVHVMTAADDWHARRTKKGRWLVRRGRASQPGPAALPEHDRERQRPLPADHPEVVRLFAATGLVSAQGNVLGAQADKYRQVQHYVELLRPLPLWDGRPLRVVDAGCGKAYMSLALYLYAELQGIELELIGVDSNPEVVESVRRIAGELGYERTRFEAGTIVDFARGWDEGPVDLLVSLHACDTATDEAIAAGVLLDAEAIVLAPCCQHELLAQLNSAREADGDSAWQPVLEHGLLRGRLADILTDSLRASALEALGYKADVIEFVAAEHTAKNLMIRAVRRPGVRRGEAARRYEALAELWGVQPALEELLAERLPITRRRSPAAASRAG